MATEWKIIHECDEDGEPTCWSREINHPTYGKYVWIIRNEEGYAVEIDMGKGGFISLQDCISLMSTKRWVAMNIE